MLKISQKTEYALRAMLELATRSDAGLTSAREISERQRIPLRFLEQQLGSLSKAGLVESFRGAGGGCRLAKEPADITVVPQTGQVPWAALRPFLRVTSSPSNSRFSRHFTQYASYFAMSPPSPRGALSREATCLGGLTHELFPLQPRFQAPD